MNNVCRKEGRFDDLRDNVILDGLRGEKWSENSP